MAEATARRSPQLQEILDKSRPRHEPEVEESTLKEARGALSAPMLDIVFRDGRIRSFNYAYLSEVEFEPGDTLTLKFSTGAAVIAEGRGLARHRQQVRRHRADEIRECTESELALQLEGLSQVERIVITEGDMR